MLSNHLCLGKGSIAYSKYLAQFIVLSFLWIRDLLWWSEEPVCVVETNNQAKNIPNAPLRKLRFLRLLTHIAGRAKILFSGFTSHRLLFLAGQRTQCGLTRLHAPLALPGGWPLKKSDKNRRGWCVEASLFEPTRHSERSRRRRVGEFEASASSHKDLTDFCEALTF